MKILVAFTQCQSANNISPSSQIDDILGIWLEEIPKYSATRHRGDWVNASRLWELAGLIMKRATMGYHSG
jgi:hypothetical protein